MTDLATPVADLRSIARSMLNGTMDITTAAAGIRAVADGLDAPSDDKAPEPDNAAGDETDGAQQPLTRLETPADPANL